jgi:hypothetical protein
MFHRKTGNITALALLLVGLTALAFAGTQMLGGGAEASHAGGMDAMNIDMDPSAAPANTCGAAGSAPGADVTSTAGAGGPTNCVIGSVETCAQINENGVTDADEDLLNGLLVDVTAVNIPAGSLEASPSTAMVAFGFTLNYPGGHLRVVTTNSTNWLLANFNGSNVSNFDDPRPDSISPFSAASLDVGSFGSEEWGTGALERMTIDAGGATAGPALIPLTLTANGHVDAFSGDYSPDYSGNAFVALDTPCPPENTATAEAFAWTSTPQTTQPRN